MRTYVQQESCLFHSLVSSTLVYTKTPSNTIAFPRNKSLFFIELHLLSMKRFAPMLSPQTAAQQAFSQAPQRQAVTAAWLHACCSSPPAPRASLALGPPPSRSARCFSSGSALQIAAVGQLAGASFALSFPRHVFGQAVMLLRERRRFCQGWRSHRA